MDAYELQEGWNWQSAENLYRAGEPGRLVALLRSDRPIPGAQRALLAQIVAGDVRLPPKTGKGNAQLTYEARERIHSVMAALQSTRQRYMDDAEFIDNEYGIDHRELMRYWRDARRAVIAELAKKYKVSVKSIPTIARRFRDLSPWPKRERQ